MKKLPIMQENGFSGTIAMYPSTMQPLCTHVDKLVTSNFQLHILVYMLNIATCRTCPGAELASVSPTHAGVKYWLTGILTRLLTMRYIIAVLFC